ncbi:MAG: pentapeptide repeat-containing protein [Planctomycetes bacterium]|nr:pentapeptide repeat-containing protein [Planctomycetota bacterium]
MYSCGIVAMPDYISKLDDLIANLESAIEETEQATFSVSEGEPPKKATFRVLSSTFSGVAQRAANPAEIYELKDGVLKMRSRADVGRNMPIEVKILAGKDSLGETMHIVQGSVISAVRISGAYEINVSANDMRKMVVPAHRRFLDCIANGDPTGWNRWANDLGDGPVLQGLDLSLSNLSGFDLCCADLTGSNFENANLSGANLAGAILSGCNLDGVKVTGTDFFRARIPRRYMGLLTASGMIEVESVILD